MRSWFKIRFLLFAAVLLLAACQDTITKKEPNSSPDEIKDLVGKIIDAYGGPRVVEGIVSLSAQGVIEAPLQYQGPAKYVRYVKRGRKLRVETESRRNLELRILNRRRSYYKANGFPLIEVRGARYRAMVFQYKELTMPYQLLKRSFEITNQGASEVNGTPVAVLGLRDKEGPPITLYVDLQRYLIVKDSGTFTINGTASKLSSEFEDFRSIDNTQLPFKVVNYADGQKVGETTILHYQVNPPLVSGLFAR